MWLFKSNAWKEIATRKTDRRAEALGTARPFEESSSLYTSASATEIVQRIGNGEWTASTVLEAYISRSAFAQEVTNCLTEVLYDQARKEARALDDYFSEHGKLKGPLHGVPVSFKDLFDIQGYDSTLGYTMSANRPASADAELVAAVRRAGGIPFVKTNVPQTMFIFECLNPLWGRTLNPFSAQHTSGGSSGGEAALVAMDGSALGWGSDIGGSLRIPASYCGIYSLKPGVGRVATGGTQANFPGMYDIPTVVGPMARSVEDIELACRLAFGQDSANYDPAPIPYRNIKLPEKLKFGYYTSDGIVQTSPVCKRAVMTAVEALRQAGHECVEFTLPNALDLLKVYVGLTSADGTKTLLEPIGNDPELFELSGVTAARLYGWFRRLSTWVLGKIFDDAAFPEVIGHAREKSVYEYWKYAHEIKALIRKFNQEVWQKHEFDAVIAPVQCVPALPHGAVTYVAGVVCGTLPYNVVDSPVGVVPVTRVDPSLDDLTEEYTESPSSQEGSPFINYCLYRAKRRVYDAQKMQGLPVGIQLVGRKWEEEKVVEIMKVVDVALGPRGFGPGSWKSQRDIRTPADR